MTTADRIIDVPRAVQLAADAVRDGKRVVTANGVFDLFSVPHLLLLEHARAQGDLLMVGVNSDASVRALKGERRPIVPEAERARIVAGLRCVEYVFVFDDADPRAWLRQIRPAVHVNSAEYGEECVEAKTLREIGAALVLKPRDTAARSTSDIIELIRSRFSQS